MARGTMDRDGMARDLAARGMGCARGGRRGIAMMLVLVALFVTTVLVGAALTARDNAPAIGANATAAAGATWSAESAANFAVGAIAQSNDLAALLGGDDVLSGTMTINGASVAIKVTNTSGAPPAETDRELIVTATATVGGVDKVITKRVMRVAGGEAPVAVDPYLHEFAAFITEKADIKDGGKIGIWDLSPEAGSSLTMAKVGTGFNKAGDMSIGDAVLFERVGLYCDTSASIALETYLAGCPDAAISGKIPLDVPTLAGGLPMAISTLPSVGTDIRPSASTSVTVAAGGKYGKLEARDNATVRLDSTVSPNFEFSEIRVDNGGVLVIRGAVSVHVKGNFDVDSGYVVLEDASSSVTFYLADDLKFDHESKVGIDAADVATPAQVVTTYIDPRRVRLIALATTSGGAGDPHWDIHDDSVAVACAHNPGGRVHLQSGGDLFGHTVARELAVESGSRLLYCPSLDSHLGYSSTSCPFYDSNGDPIPELLTILNDALAVTTTADGFINKFYIEYTTAKSNGTLDLIDLTGSVTKTVTETLNLGGLAIY